MNMPKTGRIFLGGMLFTEKGLLMESGYVNLIYQDILTCYIGVPTTVFDKKRG